MGRLARVGLVLALLASCARGVGGENDGRVPAHLHRARPAPPADREAARMLWLGGTLVASSRTSTLDIHAEPGTLRPYMDLDADNPWGQRLQLLVVGNADDEDGDIWLRVQLPIWPNGQEGWVSASDVRLRRATDRVLVDLSDRRLVLMRDGEPVDRLAVAIGASSTPTPPGRYFVWARVVTDRPGGPYGSFILGLSGFSETIEPWTEWPGQPRLAIHGTDDPDDAGHAVSNGCVRVLNALLRGLRDVPLGTPVEIRA